MKKDKVIDHVEDVEDESVFPEGHIMNEWAYDNGRETSLAKDRTREKGDYFVENESDFYIAEEDKIPGYQLAWMNEYVLGVPQRDNLRRLQRKGWDFVHVSEMPNMPTIPIKHHMHADTDDGWIRVGPTILMKKPLEAYQRDQENKRLEGEEIRRQSEALTDYMGTSGAPKFVVENKMSYQPNHKMRRG
jgi:hypothetical protein